MALLRANSGGNHQNLLHEVFEQFPTLFNGVAKLIILILMLMLVMVLLLVSVLVLLIMLVLVLELVLVFGIFGVGVGVDKTTKLEYLGNCCVRVY